MVPGNADEAVGVDVEEEQQEELPYVLNGTATVDLGYQRHLITPGLMAQLMAGGGQ